LFSVLLFTFKLLSSIIKLNFAKFFINIVHCQVFSLLYVYGSNIFKIRKISAINFSVHSPSL